MASPFSSSKTLPKKITHPPSVPLSSLASKKRANPPPEPLLSAETSTSLKKKEPILHLNHFPSQQKKKKKKKVATNTALLTTASVSTNTNTESDEMNINNKIVFIIAS